MTAGPDRRAVAGAWIVGLGLAMTLLNATKPIHMDDSVYYSYASRIADDPLDPYGGEVVDYWFAPKPGMDVLAPVFLPYVWSRAIAAHGDNSFLWKLWLAPFAMLLVGATWALARRFARGLEPAVAAMVASSPAILPSLNFMLDVPALALGLAGLAAFFRACDAKPSRRPGGTGGLPTSVVRGLRMHWWASHQGHPEGRGASLSTALVAGLLVGAAIDVKWTGLLVPAVILLYALTHRRVGLGVAACLTAASVFVGWEGWIAWRYGQSHFLTHSGRQVVSLMDRVNGGKALVAILGGLAPAVLALGLLAIRRPIAATTAMSLAAAGLAAIALGVGPQAVFLPTGAFVLLNLAHVAAVLLRRRRREPSAPRWRGDRDDLFLILWLALEVAGYFALSPYSAVRRVLGIVVAATLLVARLASRTCRPASRRAGVRRVVLAGAALGLFYFGVDLWEARVERTAARDAARDALAMVEPGRTAWYAGRWGFRHHAGSAGLTHIVPGRTELQPGDLLVVHDNKVDVEPRVAIDPSLAAEVLRRDYDDPVPIPFRTVPSFYSGKEPLQRQSGPRFVVRIYRVARPFTPLGYIPPRLAPKGRAVGAIMQPIRRR